MDHRGRQAFETEFMAALGRAVVFFRIDHIVTDAALIGAGRIHGHTGGCLRIRVEF
jgi:hypothetical protein